MRNRDEQIWEQMVLPQVSMLLDPMPVRGRSRCGVKALSAALLTVVAPAYSSACPDNATRPENQIVLMQCLANRKRGRGGSDGVKDPEEAALPGLTTRWG